MTATETEIIAGVQQHYRDDVPRLSRRPTRDVPLWNRGPRRRTRPGPQLSALVERRLSRAILAQLCIDGQTVLDAHVVRLSPYGYGHVDTQGHDAFHPPPPGRRRVLPEAGRCNDP